MLGGNEENQEKPQSAEQPMFWPRLKPVTSHTQARRVVA
jgi:hypothetical protein